MQAADTGGRGRPEYRLCNKQVGAVKRQNVAEAGWARRAERAGRIITLRDWAPVAAIRARRASRGAGPAAWRWRPTCGAAYCGCGAYANRIKRVAVAAWQA